MESVLVQEAKYFLADLYGSGSDSVMFSSSSLRIFPAEEKNKYKVKEKSFKLCSSNALPYLIIHFVIYDRKTCYAPLPIWDIFLVVEPPTGECVEVLARLDRGVHPCLHIFRSLHAALWRFFLHKNISSSSIFHLCFTGFQYWGSSYVTGNSCLPYFCSHWALGSSCVLPILGHLDDQHDNLLLGDVCLFVYIY